MDYLKAFLVGGAICMLGQILIDKTRLTPARILVCYVVLGVILGGAGVYDKLVDFAGAGATVPADRLRQYARQGRARGRQGAGHSRRADRRTQGLGSRDRSGSLFRVSCRAALQSEG